ncbi:hypothetical protein GCM10025331_48310 [Actinoplanes utahensis]|nr:hypothetical protein Aut01nite_57330 [Actinoplanes utahensis]
MTVTIEPGHITGQSQIDSYVSRWIEQAVTLINSTDDIGELAAVADALRPVFGAGEHLDAAVTRLNDLLARHGAVPNLHGHPGQSPVLAFHRPDATRVDAWAADMGTAIAMVIGVGQAARLGACEAERCARVFLDTTRNASRRFCGLTCQNRAKASAYRARRAAR